NRMATDARLRAYELARLDGVPEQPRKQLRRSSLARGGFPRVAHLAEDLALADDHRIEPGGDGKEVTHGRVVVVGVEVIVEDIRIRARIRREEFPDIADRGVEVRASRVDLGAVARLQ